MRFEDMIEAFKKSILNISAKNESNFFAGKELTDLFSGVCILFVFVYSVQILSSEGVLPENSLQLEDVLKILANASEKKTEQKEIEGIFHKFTKWVERTAIGIIYDKKKEIIAAGASSW